MYCYYRKKLYFSHDDMENRSNLSILNLENFKLPYIFPITDNKYFSVLQYIMNDMKFCGFLTI